MLIEKSIKQADWKTKVFHHASLCLNQPSSLLFPVADLYATLVQLLLLAPTLNVPSRSTPSPPPPPAPNSKICELRFFKCTHQETHVATWSVGMCVLILAIQKWILSFLGKHIWLLESYATVCGTFQVLIFRKIMLKSIRCLSGGFVFNSNI